ncbi:hypothetical protein N0A02_32050 [Paraburkholderia acidicola]|uniref:Uncharacterized protein n=1 Tax=Paraburkholderia acidicola TaxID=1912599 RepID=A0ABV1LXQ1_9BURK
MHALSRGGLSWLRDGVSPPSAANVTQLPAGPGVSWKVVVLNVLAQAMLVPAALVIVRVAEVI